MSITVTIECGNPACQQMAGVVGAEPWEDEYTLAEEMAWVREGSVIACCPKCMTAALEAPRIEYVGVSPMDVRAAACAAFRLSDYCRMRASTSLVLAVQYASSHPENFERFAHEHALEAWAADLEHQQLWREAERIAA